MSDMEKFRELGISEATIAALAKKGFEEPSPIQAAAIPLLLKGEKDVIGQAQTGTGKTAAFGIPIVEKIVPGASHVQALILTPTRELAVQIAEELNSLKGSKQLSIIPVYGGQSIDIQLRALRRGVDIVVGTPGRVMDLMRRNALNLSEISFAVLDEADEMLNMGFVEDMELILAATNKDKNMLMFSATMPAPIMNIAHKFMREYEIVKVKQRQMTADLVAQIYFEVRREDKFEALTRIIDMESDFYALVFCRTKNDVDELASRLQHRGYTAEALHGDIAQNQRTKTIEKFKQQIFNILIATDVAARGIDINNLSHVINFSIPQDAESYVHRIGRTARAGREGTAITFVTPSEYRRLMDIQRQSGVKIRKESLPRPEDITRCREERMKESVIKMVGEGLPRNYVDIADQILSAVQPLEAVAALLALNAKHHGKKHSAPAASVSAAYQERSGDREPAIPRRQHVERPEGDRQAIDRKGKAKLFVALGQNQSATPRRILEMIVEATNIQGLRPKDIACYDNFSQLSVPFEQAEMIINAFNSKTEGKAPLVEMVEEPVQRESRPGRESNRDQERHQRRNRDAAPRGNDRGGKDATARRRAKAGKFQEDWSPAMQGDTLQRPAKRRRPM